MSQVTTQLDHIVLLVSSSFFEDPPKWLTDNFTITAGGKHEGQASRNKLILFQDGTYLELFNWYDSPPTPDQRHLPMRAWAAKKTGLIDFALTSTGSASECIDAVNARLNAGDADGGLGIAMGEPVAGSRKRADGVEVKWHVTRPSYSRGVNTPDDKRFLDGRVDVPFFCHDVTDRHLRVAASDPNKTTHPCGAVGIASCDILVPAELLDAYAAVYGKICGSQPQKVGDDFVVQVGSPQGPDHPYVRIRAPRGDQDVQRMAMRGIGLSDLVLRVPSSSRHAAGPGSSVPLADDPIGSTIHLCGDGEAT